MMCREGLLFGRRSLQGCASVALAAFLLSASASTGADRFIVTRDGTKVRVAKQDQEFAVTYRSLDDVAASARRLAGEGTGVVVDVRGASRAKTKILRVADTSARRRSLVRRDPAIVDVRPVYRCDGGDTPLMSTGTINVKLRRGLSENERQQLWTDYRVEVVKPMEGLRQVYLVKPVDDDEDEVLRAEVLAYDDRTAWAEPNFRMPSVRRQIGQVNDTFYSSQWHLNNTGQGGGKVDADIDAPEAWLFADGQDVLIGMFDDACDYDHEDLRIGYIGEGHDPTLPTTSLGFSDPRPKAQGDMHGTAVMGLAVARDNDFGVRGVAYRSRFTASRGLSPDLSNADKASAFTFARQQEVDVHINSWGIPGDTFVPAILEEAIEAAFQEGRDLDGPEGDGTTNRPPRGMVVVFATGNGGDDGLGDLREAGRELATLPTVIGVGASDDSDLIAAYSDYGPEIDFLAPGGDDSAPITTTDIDDSAGYIENGFNEGGVDYLGQDDIDPAGLYTGSMFYGTSASCPIAAGVAALVLSANLQLTATSVRLIMEHTAEKVSPDNAQYDGITNRSLRYGYGRINAWQAVEAALDSLALGGRTWPERVASIRIEDAQLSWRQNGDPLEFLEETDAGGGTGDDTGPQIQNDFLRSTDEFIVFESASPFEFIPVDGVCYDLGQIGCGSAVLSELPTGVSVSEHNGNKAIGCGLACGSGTSTCEAGAEQCIEFDASIGTRYFAIYAHSSIGRYSFGVSVDSLGNVVDSGRLPPGVALGDGGGQTTTEVPKVSISVSPLEGTSPLTVHFSGNAVSALPIDETLTEWDFDIDDSNAVDSRQRTTQHTYEVPAGDSRIFIARLTMYDTAGNSGWAQVAIQVVGPATGGGGGTDGSSSVQIVIGVPGTVGSDIETGVSPFKVELSLDTTALSGSLQSVLWDLGDGSTVTSLFVTHTYVNVTDDALRLPITATITTMTSGGITATEIASRRITVLPGGAIQDQPDIVLDGTSPLGGGGNATPCGVLGVLPLAVGMLSVMGLRLRRWRHL